MKRFFVGVIVISVVALSGALTRTGDDESQDVEIITSDMPLDPRFIKMGGDEGDYEFVRLVFRREVPEIEYTET